MRHPMIAALLGLAANAMHALQFSPRAGNSGTSHKRSRVGSSVSNPSAEHIPMRQSEHSGDVNLRGYAGAKMARKAKAKTLGLRHGTSAHMKWGKA